MIRSSWILLDPILVLTRQHTPARVAVANTHWRLRLGRPSDSCQTYRLHNLAEAKPQETPADGRSEAPLRDAAALTSVSAPPSAPQDSPYSGSCLVPSQDPSRLSRGAGIAGVAAE